MDDRDLRVSDAERAHVVELLQKATGRGMLDLDEFTQRSETAYAAKTRGDLNAVLVDLPGMVHNLPGPASPARAVPESGEELVLSGTGAPISRDGEWLVPSRIVIRTKYGPTKLDFSRARIPHPVVEINLSGKWGPVELVVPENASVDTAGMDDIKWASVEDKSRRGGEGGVRFVVTGTLHGGPLKIRNPRRGLFG